MSKLTGSEMYINWIFRKEKVNPNSNWDRRPVRLSTTNYTRVGMTFIAFYSYTCTVQANLVVL